jgi:putative hydrolase of the HAD superfamily
VKIISNSPKMQGNSTVKNIIFDFGGVLIDIDFQLSIDAYVKLGSPGFEKNYCKASQSSLFDDLDTGRITPDEFLSQLKSMFPPQVTNQQLIDAWNAIIIGTPEHHIRLLEQLAKNYRIFLLSNTNLIHYYEYTAEIKRKYGYNGIEPLFEKAYLSFNIGMRKPDMEIFEYAINDSGVLPSETIFIDDSLHNIEPARKAGLRPIHLADGKDVTELFANGFLKEEYCSM